MLSLSRRPWGLKGEKKVQSLSSIWNDEPLRGLTRMEPRELAYYDVDFKVLNAALRVLYHIMGGRV